LGLWDCNGVDEHNTIIMLDWRIAKIGVDEHNTTMMLDWLSKIKRRKKEKDTKQSFLFSRRCLSKT
jgi:hypothetical protein